MIRNYLVTYVFEQCAIYLDRTLNGGGLHIVLEDDNWGRDHIEWCCVQDLSEDLDAWVLGSLILNLFPAELAELANQLHRRNLKRVGQVGGAPFIACPRCLEVAYAVGHSANCEAEEPAVVGS